MFPLPPLFPRSARELPLPPPLRGCRPVVAQIMFWRSTIVGTGTSYPWEGSVPTSAVFGASATPIARIDPTWRALFRASGAELLLKDTPPKVVISEYVGVAEAFSADNKEPKFVNAVLDHMARELLPEAFGG